MLGPYASAAHSQTVCEKTRDTLEDGLGHKLQVHQAEPPFDVQESVEGTCFWVRPIAAKPDARRKLLRKQILTSIMAALAAVVRYRPRIIVGVGQGALISALMTYPLLMEAACRYRITTSKEMTDIRQAWAGVAAIISVNPVMLPQRSDYQELLAAIPEISFLQPRGIFSTVLQSGTNKSKNEFGSALIGTGGFPAVSLSKFAEETAAKRRPEQHRGLHNATRCAVKTGPA